MASAQDEHEYYCCLLRADGDARYFVWFSGEVDGVLTRDGNIATWSSEAAVRDFTMTQGLPLARRKPAVYDFDELERFLAGETEVEPGRLLDFWNMFLDMATSLKFSRFTEVELQQPDLYNHLFYLSDCVPVQNTYPEPLTASERETLKDLFALGLNMVKQRI